MSLPFRHLIGADQITPAVAEQIFSLADYMQRIIKMKGRNDLLSDKIIGLLFFEPSSRTMLSFQSAAQRLQAGIVFAQGKESSSLTKRETIHDTVRVTSGYCDLIVMRHDEEGAARQAAEAATVPFINAGDGSNEHPTQCLIDGYTIRSELGRLHGIHAAVGLDPRQSRAIHSFVRFLANYENVTITFVCPPELAPHDSLVATLRERGVKVHISHNLRSVCTADVLYLNRLQEERFSDSSTFQRLRHEFTLDASMLSGKLPLILDPLPRIDEIARNVDALPNAAYFRQAHYGVPVRMALLALLLNRAQ